MGLMKPDAGAKMSQVVFRMLTCTVEDEGVILSGGCGTGEVWSVFAIWREVWVKWDLDGIV